MPNPASRQAVHNRAADPVSAFARNSALARVIVPTETAPSTLFARGEKPLRTTSARTMTVSTTRAMLAVTVRTPESVKA